MRFDDSLDTVMASDMTTAFGAQSAWRQLTDLIARRRIGDGDVAVARLTAIRARVPMTVRVASARSAAFADPPAPLVRLFGDDVAAVAAPVLSSARLEAGEWLAMLPEFPLTSRALLRHRRDLPGEVARALDAFGAADFALPTPDAESIAAALAEEAARAADRARLVDETEGEGEEGATGTFPIADLVARIDAYRRDNGEIGVNPTPRADPPVDTFRFETDETATIRWVEGAPREPLVGLGLAFANARVDGVVSGAFRRRAPFDNGRLLVEGAAAVAGEWRLSGVPVFDSVSGRFTGHRGVARRPRADERADLAGQRGIAPESLRQLVHELRTPTNAISGFAEMIEAQVLGPAPDVYRERAGAIRGNVRELLDAIDDVDTAARIEQGSLTLRPDIVPLPALLARIATDLTPLAAMQGATLDHDHSPAGLAIAGDAVAVERLVARLAATAIGAAEPGERIAIRAREGGAAEVIVDIDKPLAFATRSEESLLRLEQGDSTAGGASLLGAGFALRLARNLAVELGGRLAIGEDRLTLRLPAALDHAVEQQSSH